MLFRSITGIDRVGADRNGAFWKTSAPLPVSSVTADARFALDGVARNVATPVPSPEMPVDTGSPVQFVKVPLAGVPRIGADSVGALNVPPFTIGADRVRALIVGALSVTEFSVPPLIVGAESVGVFCSTIPPVPVVDAARVVPAYVRAPTRVVVAVTDRVVATRLVKEAALVAVTTPVMLTLPPT